jgi:hypothetical protein
LLNHILLAFKAFAGSIQSPGEARRLNSDRERAANVSSPESGGPVPETGSGSFKDTATGRYEGPIEENGGGAGLRLKKKALQRGVKA